MSKIEQIDDICFLKANKESSKCDYDNLYVCFKCEEKQVRDRYPNAKYKHLGNFNPKNRGIGLCYREVDE